MIRKAMNSDSKIGGSRILHLVAFGLLVVCCSFVVVSVISDSAKADSAVVPNVDAIVEKQDENKPEKKFSVYVTANGKRKKYSVAGGTVEKLFKIKNIKTDYDDIINYSPETVLKKNMEIMVRRVDYKLTSKTKKVPFSTQTTKSPDYYEGESFTLRNGVEGEDRELYLVKLVDGKTKNRIYVSTTGKKDPTGEIIAHGTKKRIIEKGSIAQSGFSSKMAISQIPATVEIVLDKNGKPINYKQKIVGPATAYCGGGTTARGKAAMPGRVAVDPKEIPYGSKLYIVSSDGKYIYGYSEAWDTGGFIHTSNTVVDLYFGSYNDCVNFGRRSVEIYVIE